MVVAQAHLQKPHAEYNYTELALKRSEASLYCCAVSSLEELSLR